MTDLAHTKALLNDARLEFAIIARDGIYETNRQRDQGHRPAADRRVLMLVSPQAHREGSGSTA